MNHYEEAERLLQLASDNTHLDAEVERTGATYNETPAQVRSRIAELIVHRAEVHALLAGHEPVTLAAGRRTITRSKLTDLATPESAG